MAFVGTQNNTYSTSKKQSSHFSWTMRVCKILFLFVCPTYTLLKNLGSRLMFYYDPQRLTLIGKFMMLAEQNFTGKHWLNAD